MAIGVTIWATTVSEGAALAASAILGWWLLALARIDWRAFHPARCVDTSFDRFGAGGNGLFLSPEVLVWHAAGAAAGYLAFRLVGEAYRGLRGCDGLGQGEAKLMPAAGAWVGFLGLAIVVLAIVVVAIVVVAGALAGLAFVALAPLIGSGHGRHDKLPFGAFLCLGLWITWAYGPVMITA